MVEFSVPLQDFEQFSSLIPEQISQVARLMSKGTIVSYTLSIDRSKLWMVTNAGSESELLYTINSLPLSPFFHYSYQELLFHDTAPWMEEICLN